MRTSLKYLFLLFLLSSCQGKSGLGKNNRTEFNEVPDSSMQRTYAQGFRVDYFREFKRVILYDPWNKGSELIRYYLVTSENIEIPKDGIRLQIPLRSMVSGSCTHHTFLEQLDLLPVVSGICNAGRTYNSTLRKAVAEGKVVDLGDPFKINLERCLLLKPDVLMINSYNQQDENLIRLKDAGVQILYNNEWMESNILGRAEWIKFIACFFNKEALADSLFRDMEARYLYWKQKASTQAKSKPTVLSGDDFRGTWYLPGGMSYTAQLFADAGAEYRYAADTTSGSIPFTFEQVLHDFHRADIWVGVTNAASLLDLKNLDERYTLFRSFQKGQVWAYTLRTAPGGGNDYWETAVARPDLLLSDFLKVFHPELLSSEPWHFMEKIN